MVYVVEYQMANGGVLRMDVWNIMGNCGDMMNISSTTVRFSLFKLYSKKRVE